MKKIIIKIAIALLEFACIGVIILAMLFILAGLGMENILISIGSMIIGPLISAGLWMLRDYFLNKLHNCQPQKEEKK